MLTCYDKTHKQTCQWRQSWTVKHSFDIHIARYKQVKYARYGPLFCHFLIPQIGQHPLDPKRVRCLISLTTWILFVPLKITYPLKLLISGLVIFPKDETL